MQNWNSVADLVNETGIVFGAQGEPVLEKALELAAGPDGRRVGVIAAANPSALRPYADRIVGWKAVRSLEDVESLVAEAGSSPLPFDAVVFYGLAEFAQYVLNEITDSTPSQQEWGELAYKVSKHLRLLLAVFPVVYVTCDVIVDDTGNQRLNINPGLQKLILGDLSEKFYVSTRRGEEGPETVVQDNPALALRFVAPARERAERRARGR